MPSVAIASTDGAGNEKSGAFKGVAMGYSEDFKDGFAQAEASEGEQMRGAGMDPDCADDRMVWRNCRACGRCDVCDVPYLRIRDQGKGNE